LGWWNRGSCNRTSFAPRRTSVPTMRLRWDQHSSRKWKPRDGYGWTGLAGEQGFPRKTAFGWSALSIDAPLAGKSSPEPVVHWLGMVHTGTERGLGRMGTRGRIHTRRLAERVRGKGWHVHDGDPPRLEMGQ